jgi:hypothetical protein
MGRRCRIGRWQTRRHLARQASCISAELGTRLALPNASSRASSRPAMPSRLPTREPLGDPNSPPNAATTDKRGPRLLTPATTA